MAVPPQLLMSALGAAGAGVGQLFSNYKNPADEAMPYMDEIPEQLNKSFNPYIQAGQRQLPGLEGQYNGLMTDPGSHLNQIGQNYHQSPGFQFALQQALQGAGHAAAAGGMAGSPQHEQQNMGIATNLANQDYNQWLQHALSMYQTGLTGSQGLYDTGANAGMRMGENLASALASKAQLAYEGQNAENQHEGGAMGSLMGGGAAALPFLFK